MFVLALVNQKGGCGKTTVAVNLAGALAELGHSTLLVDLDPQAHATMALGQAPRAGVDATIFDVLAGEGSVDEAAIAASGGIWLVPSVIELAEFEELRKQSKERVLPFNMAVAHLGLGDRTLALDYLERAYAADSQWMGWLNKDRTFDPLRSEPRFQALLKKLRLTG